MKVFSRISFPALSVIAGLSFASTSAWAVDVDGAKDLARQNNCYTCHAVKTDKVGPAWSKVAEKYRNDAQAEAKMIHHLTVGDKAKFPDGHEEDHKTIKADADRVKNLAQYILSLQ